MTFDEQALAAYVDGELDPATRALVEAAARSDAALGARLKAQQDLKALLTAHYGPVANEPLPERLMQIIRSGAPASAEVVNLATRHDTPAAPQPQRLPSRLAAWVGMAACLVVGLAIGPLALPFSVGLNGDIGQTLVATDPLARVLDEQTAAEPSGPIRIGLSFRDKAGTYCRTFQRTAAGPSGPGLPREWRLAPPRRQPDDGASHHLPHGRRGKLFSRCGCGRRHDQWRSA